MSRYLPSRNYWSAAVVGLLCSLFSAWCGLEWAPAFIPAALFFFSTMVLVFLASRPAIEIRRDRLAVGRREVPWDRIRRVDRTAWRSPLVVRLTLADESHMLLIYPGEPNACRGLLNQILRLSRAALIDGAPHPMFWGESLASGPNPRQLPSPKYPLLRAEDEAEIERLFQRLKTVGHIDPKNADEK
jgi:hypothetical protein